MTSEQKCVKVQGHVQGDLEGICLQGQSGGGANTLVVLQAPAQQCMDIL